MSRHEPLLAVLGWHPYHIMPVPFIHIFGLLDSSSCVSAFHIIWTTDWVIIISHIHHWEDVTDECVQDRERAPPSLVLLTVPALCCIPGMGKRVIKSHQQLVRLVW
mmetsp:Transcript_41695/g.45270  ORF Transcript_41695/g.45270 Transcript_41695/m.45270 type:complete len:106 (-) Transcript_41695:170-487(-)